MNHLLSNKMPELTEQEISFMGHYSVSYYCEKIKHYVSSKGSWNLFFHYAGITGKAEQDAAKMIGNNSKYLAVINSTTGYEVTIHPHL